MASQTATSPPQDKLVSISDAAAELGVTVRALRYYEELGLLQAAQRGAGGVRYYSDASLLRVRHMLELKNLGHFSLEELKGFAEAEAEMEALKESYHKDDAVADRLAIARKFESLLEWQLKVLEEKQQSLARLQEQLHGRLERTKKVRRELEQEQP